MRTLKAGLALAVIGSMMLTPLAAAGRRQDGIISGSASAEVKQKDYPKHIVRSRDVSNNEITQSTTLDAGGKFALNGLAAGSFIVELVKNASPDGRGGKVVCQEGPFTLQTGAAADAMMVRGVDIKCNRPETAYLLLAAAALAGVTAGVVAGGDEAPAAPAPTLAPTVFSVASPSN